MGDKNKVDLTARHTVQTITPLVKAIGVDATARHAKTSAIKFVAGRGKAHVDAKFDEDRKCWVYTLRETGTFSCSPAVVAQALYDHLDVAHLAQTAKQPRLAKSLMQSIGRSLIDEGN